MTRLHEPRDIGARDDEQEHSEGEDDREVRRDHVTLAGGYGMGRLHRCRESFLHAARMLTHDTRRRRGEPERRRRLGDARLQPADHRQPTPAACLE